MIHWFEVENFKSIKKLHLEMRPFMVLVGANGAGKTNVVQALSLLLDVLRTQSIGCVELYGGYEQLIRQGKRPARELRFSLSWSGSIFEVKQATYQATIALRGDEDVGAAISEEEFQISVDERPEPPFFARWARGKLERFEGKGGGFDTLKSMLRVLFPSEQKLVKEFRNLDIQALRFGRLIAILDSLGESPLLFVHRLRLDASALRADTRLDETTNQFSTLSSTGRGLPLALERIRRPGKPPTRAFKRVLQGLQEVYPNIEDVSTVHFQPGRVALSFKERTIGAELGEGNVSDGVMHALALLIAIEDEHGGVLAIEEPENALHPWALRCIIDRLQDRLSPDRPVVITTHSPVVVDAVRDPASLFIVENHPKRGTVLTPAIEKERALKLILAESGQKLGDVWLAGGLGGVPGAEV